MRTSSSSFITPLKQKNGGDSSVSRTRAITAASATISAMTAMQSRMEGLQETEERSRLTTLKTEMMEWKSKMTASNQVYSQLGGKYLVAKAEGNKSLMKQLLEERNCIKKQERTYKKEYDELKEELGYESVDCSPASVPASLPSDDEEILIDD